MSMDVYGNSPTAPVGTHYKLANYWWHALAAYIEAEHPTIAAACKYWHTNDYDGLNEDDATALANALHEDLENGTAAAYIQRVSQDPYNTSHLGQCSLCKGKCLLLAGTIPLPCLLCHATGNLVPSLIVDEEDIRKFADFARHSGGFKIA